MSINLDKLAESVVAMEERQEESAKYIELIHDLVSLTIYFLNFKVIVSLRQRNF